MTKKVSELTDDEWAVIAKSAGQDAAFRALCRGRSVRGVNDPAAAESFLIDIVVVPDAVEASRPTKD
jgi:hypothetical protein